MPYKHSGGSLRVANLNTRGCSNPDKQNRIDKELTERGIHIACLQETRLTGANLSTNHYEWHLSKKSSNKYRRLAILIRKNMGLTLNHSTQYRDVLAASLNHEDNELIHKWFIVTTQRLGNKKQFFGCERTLKYPIVKHKTLDKPFKTQKRDYKNASFEKPRTKLRNFLESLLTTKQLEDTSRDTNNHRDDRSHC